MREDVWGGEGGGGFGRFVVVVDDVVDNDGFWPLFLSLALSFALFRGFDLVKFGEVWECGHGWLVNTTTTIYYDYIL